ncbi:hypothetical protein L1987_22681 [Smallanthus sonchifolius]|uniref:Uncharacterized protein n=1 Tax=Smallanthus sonchifolius TaxID=185202 RepID=A0ACB9IFC6_9ASTR|nr:hypothetical protein L1987_22681 [Smallanthus sonchifolius]
MSNRQLAGKTSSPVKDAVGAETGSPTKEVKRWITTGGGARTTRLKPRSMKTMKIETDTENRSESGSGTESRTNPSACPPTHPLHHALPPPLPYKTFTQPSLQTHTSNSHTSFPVNLLSPLITPALLAPLDLNQSANTHKNNQSIRGFIVLAFIKRFRSLR